MGEIVYLNGKFIPSSEAKISPFDHGFLYGYGLFETMRAYDGHIFRLDRHIARLRDAAQSLGLADRLHSIDLQAVCLETLKVNNLRNARIRLTISAGGGSITPDPETCYGLTVFIAATSLIPLPQEKYETGFKAILSSLQRNSQSPLSRLKSTCYLENILARREAEAAGCDEAVLLNEKGYIAEGSTTNIFVVQSGKLITPSIESGILSGITREAVLEIARSLNINAVEKKVLLHELTQADEAFLTNSIVELVPLTWFEGKPIGSGKPGEVTRNLLQRYRKLVAEAIQ